MDSTQTTASGKKLTMITGTGGRPVDRQTVDRYCRNVTACQADAARKRAAHAEPR